jgi:hypothetical protein
MLQLIGFIISGYTGLPGRNRKPFNPLLGETFDFIHKDGWKYHAEQVTHHPPVSAAHAQGSNWEWFYTFHPKLSVSFDSLGIQSVLPIRLRLANGSQYSWNKVPMTVYNVRGKAENRLLRNEGKMTILSNTGVEAQINFLNDDANSLDGKIKDADGKILHKLVGNWDKGISR